MGGSHSPMRYRCRNAWKRPCRWLCASLWLLPEPGVPMPVFMRKNFIAILIFLSISVFVESIVRITFHVSAAEFAVAFLFVLVGLSESTSLGECVFISLLCVLSFFASIPFLYAINKRINYNERKRHFENFAFFLVSFAVIIIILLSWNTSYLQTL